MWYIYDYEDWFVIERAIRQKGKEVITKLAKTVRELADEYSDSATTAGELGLLGSGVAINGPIKNTLRRTLDPYVAKVLDEPNLGASRKWLETKLRPAMGLSDKDVYFMQSQVTGNPNVKFGPSDSAFHPRYSVDADIAALPDRAKTFVGPPRQIDPNILKAKRGGVYYFGTPDAAVIAHELGHAKSPFHNNKFVVKLLTNARDKMGLHSGLGALATYKRVRDSAEDTDKSNALTYAGNVAALTPTVGMLADEGAASLRGLHGMKKTNATDAVLNAAKKKYGVAFLSYLTRALAYHGLSNAGAYGLGKYHNYRDAKKEFEVVK